MGRCNGQTKKKVRCRNRIVFGEFCHLHGGKKSKERIKRCAGITTLGRICGLTIPWNCVETVCILHTITRYDLSIYTMIYHLEKKTYHGFFNSYIELEECISISQKEHPKLKINVNREILYTGQRIAISPYKETCYTQHYLEENKHCSVKVINDLINEFVGNGKIYIYSSDTFANKTKQTRIKNIDFISSDPIDIYPEEYRCKFHVPLNTMIISDNYLVEEDENENDLCNDCFVDIH